MTFMKLFYEIVGEQLSDEAVSEMCLFTAQLDSCCNSFIHLQRLASFTCLYTLKMFINYM